MTHPVNDHGFLTPDAICTVPLLKRGGFAEACHVLDAKSVHAINAALAAQRPLLVRGEPGTGKSQLARAVAALMGRAFVPYTVDARTDTRDLLYTVDEIARLAEAQAQGALGDKQKPLEVKDRINVRHFISPGPLWWAFDWGSAEAQAKNPGCGQFHPIKPKGWRPGDGSVVLIDEIDKADATVPNGLLDALGHGHFAVQGRTEAISLNEEQRPLVIITTNEERTLPDAFLRRCMVLQLRLPKAREALIEWLEARGEAHYPELAQVIPGDPNEQSILTKTAHLLADDREALAQRDLAPPGVAEYIDLLRVLTTLEPGKPAQQAALLKDVAEYALKKHEPEA